MMQRYIDFVGRGRIVLVNDNYLGSWIWGRMIPLLQRLGYDAETVGLERGLEGIQSIVEASGERVSLVGHGDGGRLLNRYLSEVGSDNLEAVLYIASLDRETQAPPTWPKDRRLAYDVAFPDWQLIGRNIRERQVPLDWSWKRSDYPEQYYVVCDLDEIAPAEEQRAFLERSGVREAFALESTHFPQLGRCTELCYIIHSLICRIHGGVSYA